MKQFKIGDKIRVIKMGYDDIDNTIKLNGKGVYIFKNWRDLVFEISGNSILFNYSYPVSYKNEFIGCVYHSALELVEEMKEKEIISYTLIKLEYAEAVLNILNASAWCGTYKVTLESHIEKLKQAGVLDLWFKPNYKEEKTIVTLLCDSGTFELEVSDKGIYYAPDKKYLNVEKLNDITMPIVIQDNGYSYVSKPTHVDLGCKQNVPVKDIDYVIETYKSFL